MNRKLSAALGAAPLIVLTAASPLAARPIIGTPSDDVLTGTSQADRIRGLAGNDDITGRKGGDWLFGNEGDDTFRWKNGDGHDRVDGGQDFGILVIKTGSNLRLHIEAIGASRSTADRNKAQLIGVKRIAGIEINGTDGTDRLVLSSDPGILMFRDAEVQIGTGRGNDYVDASSVRCKTSIFTADTPAGEANVVIKGSARFHDFIRTGPGKDKIWTGAGGSQVVALEGDDKIHLGRGEDTVQFDRDGGHDMVFGFAKHDFIELNVPRPGSSVLDTNRDGWLDAQDTTVRVRSGSMTIDLAPAFAEDPHGPVSVTLVGHARLSFEQILEFFD
jgi:Ca2+-binding RTX toxin-like protein